MNDRRTARMMVLWCLCLTSAPASAEAGVGVYFDPYGDNSNIHVAPFAPFYAHIVLTDSPVTSVDGVRVAYSLLEGGSTPAPVLRLTQDLYGATGTASGDAAAGTYDLAWETPRPVGGALVLVSWTLLLTDDSVVRIHLAEAAGSGFPDNLPEISSAGESYPVPIDLSCFGYGYGSAVINEYCPLPVEGLSWGGAKAMYR